ncbi:MAG: hypothetical protein V4735_07500 [Pseudomonadota bacterium]
MALNLKKRSGDDTQRAERRGRTRGSVAAKRAKATRSRRFVLIIGDEGAILVFLHGTKVVRRLFAPSPQPSHTEAMVELMRANANVPFLVLADVLDQQYVRQSFPPVSSLSVGGLVQRRLDRDFQAEDLKGYLPLGRDKTGRKEWNFLLISLAKTPLMAEWLNLVVELPNPMSGVYLAPVEAANYLAALNRQLSGAKPQPWQLLISHNKVSGFRQVVFNENRLMFTRVSQAIDDAIPAVIAGNIEQEIINTIEYLKRLGFNENSDLDATVIISQDVIDSLDLNRFGFARVQVLTPLDVAEALQLEQAALSADRFGDVVMAASFGTTKKPVLAFSTAYLEKLNKIYKARIGIRALAALLVVLLLGLSGMSVVNMIVNSSAASEAETKTAALQADLNKFKKSVGGLNKDMALKSAIVAAYDAYLKDAKVPSEFAQAMAPFVTPQHRLVGMMWDNAIPVMTKGAAVPAPGTLPLDIRVDFDFSGGQFNSTEALTRNANLLVKDIKAKMTEYDVTVEPFPWQKDEKKSEDISVDAASAPIASIQGNSVISIKFKGPKKAGATPAGAGMPEPGEGV